MLPIQLPQETIDVLIAEAEKGRNARFSVDLESQTISTPDGQKISFEIDSFRKHCLLNGLSDVSLTLKKKSEITKFEGQHQQAQPWLVRNIRNSARVFHVQPNNGVSFARENIVKGATSILSEFVASARRESMPPDTLELAKRCLLDTIGSMIIGATKPWSRIVTGFSTGDVLAGRNGSTIVGSTETAAASLAALANGTMGHGFEIDDGHFELMTHPGAVVVPAALALAERTGISGIEFLIAIVLGYELNGRAGAGVGAASHMLAGFYPTGTSGVFGATAAACRTLGADEVETVNAFGIAGSLASGIVEYSVSGGMVKRLHAGRAAEGGVTAASLAKSGFTGPTTVLEGKYGFCNMFSPQPSIPLLLKGLGSDYKIRETSVKLYACCSDIHPVIDALLEIKARDSFALDEVKEVLVESTTKLNDLNNFDGTTSIMAAQYSVPFTVALALTHDMRDPAIYHEGILHDVRLAAFQSKVQMRIGGDFDRIYPKVTAARVSVNLRDGRNLVATNWAPAGSAQNPLSGDQTEEKFMVLADRVLPAGRARKVAREVEQIERAADIFGLTRLLRFDVNKVDDRFESARQLGAR